jgi:hypothetical protein
VVAHRASFLAKQIVRMLKDKLHEGERKATSDIRADGPA